MPLAIENANTKLVEVIFGADIDAGKYLAKAEEDICKAKETMKM